MHRLVALVLLTAVPAAMGQLSAPTSPRPYFMPPRERERILTLVKDHDWAKAELARHRDAAGKGDAWSAAFLYALEGDAKHAETVRKALLARYDAESYWVKEYRKRLADPDYFKAGQVGLPDVYYDTDVTGAVMFDWVHTALSPADRKTIEDGLLTGARFRMKAMDRWTQTPNLVFKPTWLVAMIGLATGDEECLRWGFFRTKPWGSRLGGYFPVLDVMLKDGGPWHEAPIYPGAHEGLFLTARMSRYLSLYDGKDWFAHKVRSGGSAKGLMDYYLDSAYPAERVGPGQWQVRVANYGDGSTNGRGDLFVVGPTGNPGDILLHEPLSQAYNASGDPRYAAFLALIPGYEPDLWERRPLPAEAEWPAAPSRVWPDYGLAMLRSDESSSYWTNPKAIAVFQLMSRGYGHDHRDKFSISLHGAGRLFYPNYNAIQYETPAIGWTRNSVSHNTLVVDEGETRDAAPRSIRHDFSADVKFLATSASGVFEGVDQTRALFLTGEYLLDVFQASSKTPRTYDYLLHSFGKTQPQNPALFKPSDALVKRYWLVEKQQAMTTADPWALDFVIMEEPAGGRPGKFGKEWYDHTAKLRLTVAGEGGTQVVHGVWGEELAKLVGQRGGDGARLDRLSTVAARRQARDTVFVATHEPYGAGETPHVRKVTTLEHSQGRIAVKVEADAFTDYAVLDLTDRPDVRHQAVMPEAYLGFGKFGYLRVHEDGRVTARGEWNGLRLAGAKGPLTLNGRRVETGTVGEALDYNGPGAAAVRVEQPKELPECPFPVTFTPKALRVFERDRKTMTFLVRNTLTETIGGVIDIDLPPDVKTEPARPTFGPLRPEDVARVDVAFATDGPVPGRQTIPYRIIYTTAGRGGEVTTAAHGLVLYAGPTLEHVYQHPQPNVYVAHAPKLTAKFDMFQGLCRYLADDDDTVRLDGAPLFTLSDGKAELLHEETPHAFTWPHESPAHLTAHALDRCRWQMLFVGDRMLFRMDRGWTQFEKTHVTLPGRWKGSPGWKRLVAVDAAGRESDAKPEGKVRLSAAELEFPEGKWNLAIKLEPPQEVTVEGMELRFTVDSLKGDNWQVGFCQPGRFDAWRSKGPPE